jgi:hypothetical protein
MALAKSGTWADAAGAIAAIASSLRRKRVPGEKTTAPQASDDETLMKSLRSIVSPPFVMLL